MCLRLLNHCFERVPPESGPQVFCDNCVSLIVTALFLIRFIRVAALKEAKFGFPVAMHALLALLARFFIA